jgi:cytochrome c5
MSSVMTDQALIRTVSWGAIGGIVLTLFLILLGTINAGDVNERQRVDRNTRYGASSGTAERVKAVGQMNLASNTTVSSTTTQVVAATATAVIDGKKIYNGMCVACHGAGVAGAPRVGDKGAWAERIDKGASTLYANAINGVQGSSGVMPAKGGNPALSDDEIKAVVDYMVAQSH